MVPTESLASQPELTPTELTFENFWSQWGTVSGFEEAKAQELWDRALSYYTDQPPYHYHNKTHAVEVLWNVMETCDYAEANGVAVNRRLLIMSALYHDANYHLETPEEFDSKEAYSAALFDDDARMFGFKPAEIIFGKEIIMATKLGTKPQSVEEKIMIRADIANVGSDYFREFVLKNKAFFRECSFLATVKNDHTFNDLSFTANSLKVLSIYLSNDLSLGTFDKQNGRSIFVNHAVANLRQYIIETAREQRTNSHDIIRSLGSNALDNLLRR